MPCSLQCRFLELYPNISFFEFFFIVAVLVLFTLNIFAISGTDLSNFLYSFRIHVESETFLFHASSLARV